MARIKICPKCKSTDVHVDFTNAAVWAYGANAQYQCGNCQHLAVIFPEIEAEKVKELPKSTKVPERTTDTATGFFAGRLEILIGMSTVSVLLIITGFAIAGDYPIGVLLIIAGIMGLGGSLWAYKKFRS